MFWQHSWCFSLLPLFISATNTTETDCGACELLYAKRTQPSGEQSGQLQPTNEWGQKAYIKGFIKISTKRALPTQNIGIIRRIERESIFVVAKKPHVRFCVASPSNNNEDTIFPVRKPKSFSTFMAKSISKYLLQLWFTIHTYGCNYTNISWCVSESTI